MSEEPVSASVHSSPKGVQKLVVLYLAVGGLVIGGLLGWVLRVQQPLLPPQQPARPPVKPAQPLEAQLPEHAIVFTTEDKAPAATPDLLPAQATKIHCFYRFPDLSPEAQVSARWWHNGEALGPVETGEPAEEPEPAEIEEDVAQAENDARRDEQLPHIVLPPPGDAQTFTPGIYELELYSGERRLGRASFVLAENAEEIMAARPSEKGHTRIVSLVTTRRVNARGKPDKPQTTFGGRDKIYAAFTYINATAGGVFHVQWYYRDKLIEPASQELEMKGGAGRGLAWLKADKQRLLAGKYCVTIFLGGVEKPLAQARFTVQD